MATLAAAQIAAGAARAQPTDGGAAKPVATDPPATASAPAAPASGPVVHLRSENWNARLQRLQIKWRDVCAVPCDERVDPAGFFRVGGGTINPSQPFKLPRESGEVVVNAEVGSVIKRWVGFGVGMGGVGVAGFGGLFLAMSRSGPSSADTRATQEWTEFTTTLGITYLVIGGVMMLVGFPLFHMNRPTRVEVR